MSLGLHMKRLAGCLRFITSVVPNSSPLDRARGCVGNNGIISAHMTAMMKTAGPQGPNCWTWSCVFIWTDISFAVKDISAVKDTSAQWYADVSETCQDGKIDARQEFGDKVQ